MKLATHRPELLPGLEFWSRMASAAARNEGGSGAVTNGSRSAPRYWFCVITTNSAPSAARRALGNPQRESASVVQRNSNCFIVTSPFNASMDKVLLKMSPVNDVVTSGFP